jgi:AcrR family transcriptional regulator
VKTVPVTDGRRARRERNIEAVLEATFELFTEGVALPSPEMVAERVGLAHSSVYRYFPDPHLMRVTAMGRYLQRVAAVVARGDDTSGTLDERIDRFVDMWFDLGEIVIPVGPVFRSLARQYPLWNVQRIRMLQHIEQQVVNAFAEEFAALSAPRRDMARTTIVAMLATEAVEQAGEVRQRTMQELRGDYRVLLAHLLTS